jgi:hypothetical protein
MHVRYIDYCIETCVVKYEVVDIQEDWFVGDLTTLSGMYRLCIVERYHTRSLCTSPTLTCTLR